MRPVAEVPKLASWLESGLNLNEPNKVIAAAAAPSKIAAAKALYIRESVMNTTPAPKLCLLSIPLAGNGDVVHHSRMGQGQIQTRDLT